MKEAKIEVIEIIKIYKQVNGKGPLVLINQFVIYNN